MIGPTAAAASATRAKRRNTLRHTGGNAINNLKAALQMASVDHCQLVAAYETRVANYSFSSFLGIYFDSFEMIAGANRSQKSWPCKL